MNETIKPCRRGSYGQDVKAIQEWLNLSGVYGCKVAIDGHYGAATEEAVMRFQHSAGLEPDGIAGNETIEELTLPLRKVSNYRIHGVALGEAIRKTARAHLLEHPREVGGQNKGPWVRYYMRGNEGDSFPWCCGFVSTVIMQALAGLGMDPVYSYQTSCTNLMQAARRRGWIVSTPEPGDVFCIRSGGIYNHTGIVTGVDVAKGIIDTIEGNTNDEGSREGFEVCERVRSFKDKDFFKVLPAC